MTISRACLKAARAKRDVLKTLRADPYYLGDEAWHFGAPEQANPFIRETEEHADWLKGWRDAQFETAKRA